MVAPASALPEVRSGLTGSLVIAMPLLQDRNFARMVTVIISHDESGAFGIVLGPPIDLTIADLATPLDQTWRRHDVEQVRYGGPVERSRIWLLHGGEEPLEGAATIAPGVHLGSSPELLRQLGDHAEIPVMVFSGYAGWAPGQLEREIQEKSWMPGNLDPELVFQIAPAEVWEQSLERSHLSPGHIASGLGASA
jgi:putative transcriptional regulator